MDPAAVERRRASVPVVRYPAELPITERREEILDAIRDHQVVVLAGETGSGKSTQLPKLCLELGRGVEGLIGHTQPRRLAARTVAERVAEELGTTIGELVGYTVRFTDRVGERTLIRVMTDGILLNEIQRDRMLRRYDTLIIDEAHERSLNIDFILGYLRQLLPKRPDLKVIITSATIDTARFSAHFGDAPIIEVSGRTYPVEVRHQPVVDDEADTDRPEGHRDQIEAICDAVRELSGEGPGDILVFLSGEREIRDTADALTALQLRNTELLPLYARLSAAEQHRVFQPHGGRRVVLATNVAETSLTVPGIRYVVDAGTARISRYNRRTKVQRLPIEPVSQAAADQRAGRCGRVAPGICIRLYAEDDYLARPEFTEPEILRTNLASVILQMEALGLGDVAAFPFVDPPDARTVKDGVVLLEELGALDPDATRRKRLTPLGRRLARLPLDPRLGRMVLEADRHGCVHEVLVIAAALSIQDPRERPVGKQAAADQQHARFKDPDSDFVGILNLWRYLRDKQRELGSNQFRRTCKAEYLNHLRVREWMDVYSQLRQVAGELDIRLNAEPAEPNAIHATLLAGLLDHIGLRDEQRKDYLGARNARFAIGAGSVLARKSPKWVMAAELVETNRLWARVAGRIQPEWIERAGAHLVEHHYSDPVWDAERGAVMATERVTLYGLPVVAGRRVNFGAVDPVYARDLFIQHALVEGDWRTHHSFTKDNAQLVAGVLDLEARARRRGILVDEGARFDFFDARLPADVVSVRHFDRWWKRARDSQPDLLSYTLDDLLAPDARGVTADDFPDTWVQGDLTLPVAYELDATSPTDGVTVHVPLTALNRLRPGDFDWQVPGRREELVTALLRNLPRALRRNFVPVTDHAADFLANASPADGPLLPALAQHLSRRSGVGVLVDDWDLDGLPPHLRISFAVTDGRGRVLAVDKDLLALRARLQPEVRAAVAAATGAVERTGLTAWDVGVIPKAIEVERDGHVVRGFPTLVDDGESVALRVLPTRIEQQRAMWDGVRRLLLLTTPSPTKALSRRLTKQATLALTLAPHDSTRQLVDDCVTCAVDGLMAAAGGPPWDEEGFESLRQDVTACLLDTLVGVVTTTSRILTAARAVERRVDEIASPTLLDQLTDARVQVARLVFPGFVAATGTDRLVHVERYVQAVERRLDAIRADPARDRQRMAQVLRVQERYDELARRRPYAEDVRRLRWLIEELRVSVFAQSLGTAEPVSEQRVLKAIAEAARQRARR